MSTTVKQPTFAPTNKFTALMLAGVVYEFLSPFVEKLIAWIGDLLDVALELGYYGDVTLQFAVMAIAGYFIKDAPNVPPAPPSSA